MGASDRDNALRDMDSAKLAAVKAILGRVGHDFSNLLTPLLAYPAMVRTDLPTGARAHELLNVMERAAQDMAGVTRLMVDFSLCDDFISRPIDLNDIVVLVVSEMKRALPANIQLETDIKASPSSLLGGGDQLGRVVEKLWQNALEAMPTGGRLSVSTSRLDLKAEKSFIGKSLSPGPFLALTVADTGRGVPESARHRVFEPFFTTKRDRAKRGAGLGLTYAYVTAAAHGGAVDLACPTEGGTRVTVYLPASSPA